MDEAATESLSVGVGADLSSNDDQPHDLSLDHQGTGIQHRCDSAQDWQAPCRQRLIRPLAKCYGTCP